MIYQVVWQRLLFQAFGVDIKSATVIVSAFMFGLGLGALLGGYFTKKFKDILLIFSLFEFLIGIFGLCSYWIIMTVDSYSHGLSYTSVFIVNFTLLLIPTAFMGATLPMLTFYLNTFYKSIGKSIGNLYFYNTMGAAFGSISVPLVFLFYFDVIEVLFIAAGINFLVAFITFRYIRGSHSG